MRVLFTLMAASLAAACASSSEQEPEAAQHSAPVLQPIDDPAIHKLIQVSPRILSGAAPEAGDEAFFAALQKRGVKTIVSVDGAAPDVETARRYGLRYVHIPIGYDGVPDEASMQIVAAMEQTKGPIYFHCHHGVHRGPSAAAIALQAETGCSGAQAADLLRLAKTDPKYKGLWRDIENWSPPAQGAPRPKLVEVAEVADFVEAMVKVDAQWDSMKAVQAAAWKVPADHPDLVPAKEAKILAEIFAGLTGTLSPEQKADKEFMRLLTASQQATHALQQALEGGDTAAAELGFGAVKKGCADCHKAYRD